MTKTVLPQLLCVCPPMQCHDMVVLPQNETETARYITEMQRFSDKVRSSPVLQNSNLDHLIGPFCIVAGVTLNFAVFVAL